MSTLLCFVPFCYLKTKPVEVRTIRLLCKGAGTGQQDEQDTGVDCSLAEGQAHKLVVSGTKSS